MIALRGSASELSSPDVRLAGHTLPLIGCYGYPAVFLGVMAEGVGAPLLGETVLIAAGALVHRGTLGRASFVLAAAVVLAFAPRWAYRRAMRPEVGEAGPSGGDDLAGERTG